MCLYQLRLIPMIRTADTWEVLIISSWALNMTLDKNQSGQMGQRVMKRVWLNWRGMSLKQICISSGRFKPSKYAQIVMNKSASEWKKAEKNCALRYTGNSKCTQQQREAWDCASFHEEA